MSTTVQVSTLQQLYEAVQAAFPRDTPPEIAVVVPATDEVVGVYSPPTES